MTKVRTTDHEIEVTKRSLIDTGYGIAGAIEWRTGDGRTASAIGRWDNLFGTRTTDGGFRHHDSEEHIWIDGERQIPDPNDPTQEDGIRIGPEQIQAADVADATWRQEYAPKG